MIPCLLLLLLLIQWESILWSTVSSSPSASGDSPSVAKPGCSQYCGDVKIPYPFGIGSGCFHNESYEIVCDTSRPLLQLFNLEVVDITWGEDEFHDEQTVTVRTSPQNVCATGSNGSNITDSVPLVSSIDLTGSPYSFSIFHNIFMVEGCSGSVVLMYRSGSILTGCASVCPDNTTEVRTAVCYGYGIGGCQAPLSSLADDSGYQSDFSFYRMALNGNATPTTSHTCFMAAAVVEAISVKNFIGKLQSMDPVHTVLEWRATFVSNLPSQKNVSCQDGACRCFFPYEGNPYLPNGCQVVRQCQQCPNACSSSDGTYFCSPTSRHGKAKALVLGFSVGIGSAALILASYWIYRLVKRRKEMKQKAKHFKRNGGLLLQQQMSSSDGVVEKTQIFVITELEKATDSFNDNRVLGRGGQGIVYKGMLKDGKIVAIKKSRKVDEGQIEHFINEVVILSQINHRNVVRLLGCCLETEVPLLVYEFVPNGTLYQQIHDPSEEFQVTWKMRLQIAAEAASAVAYLHSSSSAPIYHRDIKSSNILLDDKYRAKVSGFGTSRAISMDQTHISTRVQGAPRQRFWLLLASLRGA